MKTKNTTTTTNTKYATKGTPTPITLPPQCGLVLEGGGSRCCYTGGVLDSFLEHHTIFPYVIGVSAGAGKALSYVSGQRGRNKVMARDHMHKKEYMSLTHLLKGKPYLNSHYVFHEMPKHHLFFDWETFQDSKIRFRSGAYDCEQGETVWFEKEEMTPDFSTIQASTQLPYVSNFMEIHGKKLLDGGLKSPIPIEQSIADGNKFHVIVLTQAKGYRKEVHHNPIPKLFYKNYPHLVNILQDRANHYNAQVELCEQLEKDGKALIIRPKNPVELGALAKDSEKFVALYEEGEEDGSFFSKTLAYYFGQMPLPLYG